MIIETSNHSASHQPVQAAADEGFRCAKMPKLRTTKVQSEPWRNVMQSETPEQQIICNSEFPSRPALKL